jgi:hypothetical protein
MATQSRTETAALKRARPGGQIEVHSIDWTASTRSRRSGPAGPGAITDIFRPDGVYGAWGWRGLTAYFAGFLAEIPFMVLPPIAGLSYTGYFPGHLTGGADYSWRWAWSSPAWCTCCCRARWI